MKSDFNFFFSKLHPHLQHFEEVPVPKMDQKIKIKKIKKIMGENDVIEKKCQRHQKYSSNKMLSW